MDHPGNNGSPVRSVGVAVVTVDCLLDDDFLPLADHFEVTHAVVGLDGFLGHEDLLNHVTGLRLDLLLGFALGSLAVWLLVDLSHYLGLLFLGSLAS